MKNVNLQQLFYFKIAMNQQEYFITGGDHRRTSFYTAEEGNTAYTESHYSEFGTGGAL